MDIVWNRSLERPNYIVPESERDENKPDLYGNTSYDIVTDRICRRIDGITVTIDGSTLRVGGGAFSNHGTVFMPVFWQNETVGYLRVSLMDIKQAGTFSAAVRRRHKLPEPNAEQKPSD